jgi:hypothetical protein
LLAVVAVVSRAANAGLRGPVRKKRFWPVTDPEGLARMSLVIIT